MTNPDPEQIAAGLTATQRDCVLFWGKGYFASATLRSIHQRGLTVGSELNPLGIAVRNHLKGSDNG